MLRVHQQHPTSSCRMGEPSSLARHGKRKAQDVPDGNERLSKRLSLLNLEHGSQKLYVPVESPRMQPALSSTPVSMPISLDMDQDQQGPLPDSSVASVPKPSGSDDASMQLDDSKYKVYIYNLDDELDDDDTKSDEDDNAKLVMLPDLDKHLKAAAQGRATSSRSSLSSSLQQAMQKAVASPPIPRPVAANAEGEVAGMQLVLYRGDPGSLSVPREQDSVRQAILDARARILERQKSEVEEEKEEDDMADESLESRPAIPAATGLRPEDSDAMDID